jgi:hypothetical protein
VERLDLDGWKKGFITDWDQKNWTKEHQPLHRRTWPRTQTTTEKKFSPIKISTEEPCERKLSSMEFFQPERKGIPRFISRPRSHRTWNPNPDFYSFKSKICLPVRMYIVLLRWCVWLESGSGIIKLPLL